MGLGITISSAIPALTIGLSVLVKMNAIDATLPALHVLEVMMVTAICALTSIIVKFMPVKPNVINAVIVLYLDL